MRKTILEHDEETKASPPTWSWWLSGLGLTTVLLLAWIAALDTCFFLERQQQRQQSEEMIRDFRAGFPPRNEGDREHLKPKPEKALR